MSQNEKPLLSVVLLSYNSKHFLEQFLPPLIKHTPDQFEIVVVNNGSTDDTESYLNNNFPEVRTIKIEKNKGFTNGYVESLKQIDAKYYCLISSDIEVTENWAQPVVELMEKETLALKLMLDSQSTRVAHSIREALREGRLSYRLSIEQAADYIGVSARTLNRYLAKEGTHFKNLLNEERIALANKLLVQSSSCLEDIAQDVGYSSRRSFDRAFSLAVGYSPAQVRNKGVFSSQIS